MTRPQQPSPPDKQNRSPLQRLTAFETALLAGGVVLFLVLLYEMLDFLSPPLIGAAGLIMLWPLRQHPPVRTLMLAAGFLLLLWFLAELSSILIPFAVVYVLAFLFEPAVDHLQRRWNVQRWMSSLLVTLLAVGVLVLIVLLLIPSIVDQLGILARRAVEGIDGLRDWLATTPFLDNLEAAGLFQQDELTDQLTGFIRTQANQLTSALPEAFERLLRSIGSIFGLITIVAIMPVVLFYTLKDYPFIKRRLVELFPTFGGRRDYLVEAGVVVGNYLRGQLTISAIATFNISLFLWLFGVPFALLIGLVGGLLNLIPNLGAIITHVIALIIAFLFGDPWLADVIAVLAVLTGQSLLEQSILTPKILSHHVGLHPVLILLSLFVFGYFLGIFGLLIAVPATALIMTLYKAYRKSLTLELSSSSPTPPPASSLREPAAPPEAGSGPR